MQSPLPNFMSVQGFCNSDTRKSGILIGLAGHSYKSVGTAVLQCDQSRYLETKNNVSN